MLLLDTNIIIGILREKEFGLKIKLKEIVLKEAISYY